MNDIIPRKNATKHFYNVKLTSKKYICNMAVCKAQDAEDTWFIANNLSAPYAIREYKKDLILKKCLGILRVVVLI